MTITGAARGSSTPTSGWSSSAVLAAKLEQLSPRSKSSLAMTPIPALAKKDVASNVSTVPGKSTPSASVGTCLDDGSGSEGRIFLIDTMSFIFRAYHAMARQRPMSTRTGLPTAAIYVFVNMLRKLRDDFSPHYLAAVFDVAGRTFRDEQADSITSIRKFDIKTQTFTEVEYKGYKANRKEMPEDLAQQVPYIRRALEAYRIPMIGVTRFEADDVIGTLARKAAEASYSVYIVSSDKDMMQLVNDKVHVLNPPKDNLICDAAKVEEILGVPPERVIDVMALRGDSIDNIPGAPGIGDKGSVDLIQKYGTLENLLEHADEVDKKTYRESLLNNRDTILFSREMATIDCDVDIDLDVEKMHAGEPDIDTLRALFTELEFTSLLKELLPVVEAPEGNYREAKSAAEVEQLLKSRAKASPLAVAVNAILEVPDLEADEESENLLPLRAQASMFAEGVAGEGTRATQPRQATQIAISVESGSALTVSSESGFYNSLNRALGDVQIPKAIHD